MWYIGDELVLDYMGNYRTVNRKIYRTVIRIKNDKIDILFSLSLGMDYSENLNKDIYSLKEEV